jgi:hypothetical protein
VKRPSLQFYPGDWSGNANLKRCTFEEKGVWVDVMCLMHDQPEYGVLRWPLVEIAEAVKCRVQVLQGLTRKHVLKGSDDAITDPFIYVPRSGRKNGDPVALIPAQPGPLWYCSRMVRDEYVRANAGKSTRFGNRGDGGEGDTMPAAGSTPRQAPGQRDGERRGDDKGDGSSSSSSSSPSVKRGETAELAPQAPPPEGEKRKRKTPLSQWPEDLQFDDELRQYTSDHLPDSDAPGVWEKFHGLSISKRWTYAGLHGWRLAYMTFVRDKQPNSGHWSSGQYPRKKAATANGQTGMRYSDGTEVKW